MSTSFANSQNDFNWRRVEPVAQERTRLRNGALIVDLMTAQEKQDAHRASVRAYDKRKRDEAALRRSITNNISRDVLVHVAKPIHCAPNWMRTI